MEEPKSGNSLALPSKFNIHKPSDPAIPPEDICPRENVCTCMSSWQQLQEPKTRNNPNVYQRTDKLYNIHTLEYDAIRKIKKLEPHGIV